MKQSGAVIGWLASWSWWFNEHGIHMDIMDAIWSCISGFFTPQCHDVSLVSCLSRIEKAQTRPKCKLTGQLLLLHDEDGFQNPYEAKHGKHENLKMDSGRFWFQTGTNIRDQIHSEVSCRDWHDHMILVKSPIHPSTRAEAKSSEVEWKHGCPTGRKFIPARRIPEDWEEILDLVPPPPPPPVTGRFQLASLRHEISMKYQASKDGCCA